MIVRKWLAINGRGAVRVREQKPDLKFDEIAMRLQVDIPKELFIRPSIDAKMTIENIPKLDFDPKVILNTKDLIEQETGAKIEMTVIHEEKKDE